MTPVLIAGMGNGKVIALDVATGRRCGKPVSVSVRAAPRSNVRVDVAVICWSMMKRLYAVSYQGRLIAIDLRNGRRLWETNASSYVDLSAGFGNIYVVACRR